MVKVDPRDLRTALQYAVAQICTEQELNAGNEMSSGAIQALSELAFQYSTTLLSNDMKAFSLHANRKLVKVDDVLLVVRKNPTIQQKLQLFVGKTPSSTKRDHTSDNFWSESIDVRPYTSNAALNSSTLFHNKLIQNMDSTQESDNDNEEVEYVAMKTSSTPAMVTFMLLGPYGVKAYGFEVSSAFIVDTEAIEANAKTGMYNTKLIKEEKKVAIDIVR